MKKLYILLLFVSILMQTGALQAQDDLYKEKKRRNERIFYGGNFSLAIGSITWIELSPLIGYRLTPRLSSGIGITYIYQKYDYGLITYKTHIYGGKVFADYTLIRNIGETIGILDHTSFFLHGEHEVLSLERAYFDYLHPFTPGRMVAGNTWLGFGLKQHFGGNSGLFFMIMWNMSGSRYTPYSSPVLKAGFLF